MTGGRNYEITSLQRGLQLLALFAKSDEGLTASQVVKLSGLPVSTVHRFLVNLERAGFLTYDDAMGYQLGIACIGLGQAALARLDIRRAGLPYLQEINRETRETVHLTVLHGISAVYVEKLDSPEPLRIHSKIGRSVSLHSTAVGKILLAYLPTSEQSELLEKIEFHRYTPNTVGSIPELRVQLERVRRQGHACDMEENEAHIRCIAAPVWDHTGAVSASLSVTGPAVRMPIARLRRLAPLVSETGLKISRELGYDVSRLSRATAAPKETEANG